MGIEVIKFWVWGANQSFSMDKILGRFFISLVQTVVQLWQQFGTPQYPGSAISFFLNKKKTNIWTQKSWLWKLTGKNLTTPPTTTLQPSLLAAVLPVIKISVKKIINEIQILENPIYLSLGTGPSSSDTQKQKKGSFHGR